MKDEKDDLVRQQAEVDVDPRIDLAVERTELALERTHLAWIRTVITLMVSGFGLDQLVEGFRSARLRSGEAIIQKAHITGLTLTIMGTLLIAISSTYYAKRSRQLRKMRGMHKQLPGGLILSVMIFLIGLTLIYLIVVT